MSSGDLEKGPVERELGESSRTITSHPKSELEIFQTLVGVFFLEKGGFPKVDPKRQIKPASPFADIFLPSKAARERFRNRGLYDRALSQDMKNRLMYTMSHYIIAGFYIVQIVLAACITAVSAYKDSSSVDITVLGALNTVVAGMLAWLTGQGMPVRFRLARDQYREVVRAIETSERMFAEIEYHTWPEGERPSPIAERDRLEKMYDQARLDQESNYPETHTNSTVITEDHQEKKNEVDKLTKELDLLKTLLKSKAEESVHGVVTKAADSIGLTSKEPTKETKEIEKV